MWVGLGIHGCCALVWQDVVDGSEGEHDQAEGCVGGVKSVGAVDDEPDAAVGPSCRALVMPRRIAARMPARRFRMVRARVTKGLRRLRDALAQNRSSRTPTSASVRSPANTARNASLRV